MPRHAGTYEYDRCPLSRPLGLLHLVSLNLIGLHSDIFHPEHRHTPFIEVYEAIRNNRKNAMHSCLFSSYPAFAANTLRIAPWTDRTMSHVTR